MAQLGFSFAHANESICLGNDAIRRQQYFKRSILSFLFLFLSLSSLKTCSIETGILGFYNALERSPVTLSLIYIDVGHGGLGGPRHIIGVLLFDWPLFITISWDGQGRAFWEDCSGIYA